MANITAIQRRIEYGRFYADAELTEDGAYLKGEVPETYSGSFIAQIQVCYALVSTDISGRMLLTTYNPPDLLDKDDNDGLQILSPEGDELRPVGTAGSSVVINLSWMDNSYIPDDLKTHAGNMWEVMQREMGEWYV